MRLLLSPAIWSNAGMANTGGRRPPVNTWLDLERDSFIWKGVTGNTHIKKGLIKPEDPTARPRSLVDRAHDSSPGILQQHHSQPPQLHCGPPANQSRSQWFIIARGRPEASSLHGNAALLRSQHHSTADDKLTASKPRPHLSDCTKTFDINKFLYICVVL
jgi:hypothetical protein